MIMVTTDQAQPPYVVEVLYPTSTHRQCMIHNNTFKMLDVKYTVENADGKVVGQYNMKLCGGLLKGIGFDDMMNYLLDMAFNKVDGEGFVTIDKITYDGLRDNDLNDLINKYNGKRFTFTY